MTDDLKQSAIVIIDFGSQYTQLIARRVRELGVYSEILPYDVAPSVLNDLSPNGVILSGGPETVTGEFSPNIPEEIFAWQCPVLGICYGMQALAEHFGGQVAQTAKHEFGHATLTIENASPLLVDDESCDVWMSHGDHVSQLPPAFVCLASTDNAPIAAMMHSDQPIFGLQFHPEVTHTAMGQALLSRFVLKICACPPVWTTEHIIEEQMALVKQQVGQERVLLGLSGGVDSAVVAALLHQAIGDQLTAVFIDTGLMRLNESQQVMATFAEHLNIQVVHVNAEKEFLTALAGIEEPEAKRKVCGRLFIELFEAQLSQFRDAKWLAQGTIYPDVVESAQTEHGKAHVIKSHHNVGGLPDTMQLGLVEPLRLLFKDEVRAIGLSLGLPENLVMRHPFPGPGLAVRILGEVNKARADCLRLADNIFIEELRRHNLYDEVSQAFAVFLPVNSVGVVGDARRYAPVIALRAVQTIDFMTAHWAPLPHDFLALVSNRIVNEISGVSRVVYDISGKPPATIEWE